MPVFQCFSDLDSQAWRMVRANVLDLSHYTDNIAQHHRDLVLTNWYTVPLRCSGIYTHMRTENQY